MDCSGGHRADRWANHRERAWREAKGEDLEDDPVVMADQKSEQKTDIQCGLNQAEPDRGLPTRSISIIKCTTRGCT